MKQFDVSTASTAKMNDLQYQCGMMRTYLADVRSMIHLLHRCDRYFHAAVIAFMHYGVSFISEHVFFAADALQDDVAR